MVHIINPTFFLAIISSISFCAGPSNGLGNVGAGTGLIEQLADEGKKKIRVKGKGNAYVKAGLDFHNELRQKHQVADLQTNPEINQRAVECSKHYAKIEAIDHSCPKEFHDDPSKKYGENIFETKGSTDSNSEIVKQATQWWYDEISNYDFKKGAPKDPEIEFRHFTQIVWKKTKNVGIGVERKGNRTYVTALYSPQGNIVGKYAENVLDNKS